MAGAMVNRTFFWLFLAKFHKKAFRKTMKDYEKAKTLRL